MGNVRDSAYWKAEIIKTQENLSALLNGETSGVKATKSNDDTLTFQEVDKMAKEYRMYLAYCEDKYLEALEKEEGNKKKSKSILYFNSGYGY